MKTTKLIFSGIIAVFLFSCTDYLDPYPNGDLSRENISEYQAMVQGLIGQCYDNMSRNYDNNEGAYFDCTSDNAVQTSTTSAIRQMAVGALTTGQDPFLTYWDRDYKSINLVNIFLEDRMGYNTKFLIVPRLDSIVRNRLQGEAFALRAYFQWDLLQKFGGKGNDGQMLGFPIITTPVDYTKEVNVARNTYDECVKQILSDCDSAYKYLPIAHRDFLVPNVNDRAYAGGRFWGRMDGITTRAIKAAVYLTWASPRFNPGNIVSRWDSAAVNAKKVIDFKLNVDGGVTKGFNPVNGVNWFDPNFPGIVWSSRFQDKNDAMERMFYPGGFLGNGTMGATQELVDAFPMKNGYPITDPRSGYDPADPYKDRDPRFYSVIFHNGAKAIRAGKTEVMYTFENYVGGKDEAGVSSKNSRTNYHIKKMVFMGLNWSDASINRQPHSNFFIRWAHIVLTFAEAANQSVGPTDAGRYGLSATDAVKYLRTRKSYDGAAGFEADPYLDEVSGSKTTFDMFVKNERRIETCFEGMRFFDLQRWTTSLDQMNKPVHGVLVTKTDDGKFNYNYNFEVEKRNLKSAYLPIPYQEILRMNKLVQNEGWDEWK